MAKKHFEYIKRNGEEEMVIYYIENQQTGKRNYFVLERLPEEYQNNEKGLRYANRLVEKYNKEKNKKAEIVYLEDKEKIKHWFFQEPTSMIGAKAHAVKNDLVVFFKKATKETRTKAIALGLATTILVGSIAGITALGNKGDDGLNNNDITIGEQAKPPIYNDNWTAGTNTSQSPNTTISPDTTISPEVEKKTYTDLTTLSFGTYESSNGTTFVEVADMLKIAEACYNNLEIELKNANHNYSFDISKFNPEMYVGEAIQESSLKYVVNYVNKYGCRGMFMIGTDATKEANEVSKKLTGKEIISDSKELDNPVEAMMTCMYISVRNFEYCADIIGAENVTPEMVYDCYLFGCGNVRKWLKACMVDGKYNGGYKPQAYSQRVLYYGDCLEPYNDELKQGKTNGEHDSSWKKLHTEGLWLVPDFQSEATENERE